MDELISLSTNLLDELMDQVQAQQKPNSDLLQHQMPQPSARFTGPVPERVRLHKFLEV